MGKRKREAGKLGGATAQTVSSGTRAEKALRHVVEALEHGRRRAAVRLFLQGLSHDIAPKDRPLLKWLTGAIGRAAASELVEAFVHFPCFYCKKGRMQCENCDGKGNHDDGSICRACIGIGVARCDFCDGSGWVTLEYVPEGLRPVVIKNRAALALHRMREMLNRPPPRLSREDPDKAARHCSRLLLNLDRQMGVFENMLLAIDHLPDSNGAKAKLWNLADKCVRIASKGEGRIRDTILCLAEARGAKARDTRKGSKEYRQAQQRADFYKSLVDAERTLAGTGLEHPFLHTAVREAVQQRESGS